MTELSIDEKLQQFEKKLQASINFKYRNEGDFIKSKMLSVHFINTFDIKMALSEYRKSSYPQERLEKVIYMLMDMKLQMYLIETDLGAANNLLQIMSNELETDQKKAHTELMLLSFDQSLIFKSRALWERLMNLVYYLETGKEIKARSKKTKFFSYLDDKDDNNAQKWSFLSFYKDYVEWFDNTWRTPEAHGGSSLRSAFMGDGMSNDEVNKILGLNDIVSNVFFTNLLDILRGDKASRWFWTYGMGHDKLTQQPSSTTKQ